MKISNLSASGVLCALAAACFASASRADAPGRKPSAAPKPATVSVAKAADHFWELGAGEYGSGADPNDTWAGFTSLDKARFDWVFVLFGNENPTGKDLNRLLKLNPNLKFMVRLWPIGNLGGSTENHSMATFLDYLYAPGIKEKILANTSQQIHQILDTIDKPQNVVGFTLIEELPFHFSDNALASTDPKNLTWDLKKYQKQIEAERGKPLAWDAEARLWWGQKFTGVLNEINAHIKKESGGKKVFAYLQAGTSVLDYLPKDADINAPGIFPFHMTDVLKPGVADGFFVYPNTEQNWRKSLELAAKNNWLIFSQLSHPSGMRVDEWTTTLARVKEKHPNNLGYFFFCGGICRNESWGDDPAIAADNNVQEKSAVSHHRIFGASEKIGMNIVERNLQPEIQLQFDSAKKPGETIEVTATIRNKREGSWFVKDEDATLKNVKLRIEAPFEYSWSTPGAMNIGDIKPGAFANAVWRLKAKKPVAISAQKPLKVFLTSDNAPAFTTTVTASQKFTN